MKKLLVIADDFTGALDTSVKFCGKNLNVLALSENRPDLWGTYPDVNVLVINADTRHLDASNAYEVVFNIAKKAVAAGFDFIYKKTDSALRGNIGAELAAVMDAMKTGICFIPAYPETGRTTKNGIQYINDIPVAESIFGKDPFNPVKNSSVLELIREQTTKPVVLHSEEVSFTDNCINVYDASSDADIKKISTCLEKKIICAAGCAGFASVLIELMDGTMKAGTDIRLCGPFMISCGSINPITIRQVAFAKRRGAYVVNLKPNEKLDPTFIGSQEYKNKVSELCDKLNREKFICLGVIDENGETSTADYAGERGYDLNYMRRQISSALAEITSSVIDNSDHLTLMCVGGDTMRSTLDALKVTEIWPITELYPGVVYCSFKYKDREYNLITKSGGFGEESILFDIAERFKTT